VKYLVIGNQVVMASEHEAQINYLELTNKWITKKKEDGTVEAAYSFASGGGFFIFNVKDHEDLLRVLAEFPLRPLSELEVHGITDFVTANRIVTEAMKKIKID
jgi:muconolactone delta-isomerase